MEEIKKERDQVRDNTNEESKTNWTSWLGGQTRYAVDFKLTVTPVILSLLYGLSPAYIGGGVGSFSTKLSEDWEGEEYDWSGSLVDSGSGSFSESDSPTGLVLLGGFSFGDKPVFFNLEARYVVGTKAKLGKVYKRPDFDLSGLQLGLLAGIRV